MYESGHDFRTWKLVLVRFKNNLAGLESKSHDSITFRTITVKAAAAVIAAASTKSQKQQ